MRKLLLLSPLGVKTKPDDFDLSRTRFMRGSGPPRWAVSVANALWGKVSPFTFLRFRTEAKCREVIQAYVERVQRIDDPLEKASLSEYLF